MEEKYLFFQRALKCKQKEQREEALAGMIPLDERDFSPKPTLDFASQDVLSLSSHPYVQANALEYGLKWEGEKNFSCLMEHLTYHSTLEKRIGELIGKQSVLLSHPSCKTHQTLLSTLASPHSLIFIDRLCQKSLIQAATMSKAQLLRYEHQNLKELQRLLSNHQNTPCNVKLIISESLFGSNGEVANLTRLSALAKAHRAILYIDDSFGVEVLGKYGMGLSAHRKGVDIVVGSFRKPHGSFGTYIGCHPLLRDYLLSSNPQTFATSPLPAATLGAISAALTLIPDMEVERQKVLSHSHYLKEELYKQGWEIGRPSAHIIPLLCESETQCLKLHHTLKRNHIFTTPLLPSKASQGAPRLRLILRPLHGPDQLQPLLQILTKIKEEPSLCTI